VERAIAALDAYDGDADLEPSLGSAGGPQPYSQRLWGRSASDEREEECEGEGDYDEREPSCGWSVSASAAFRNSAEALDPATVPGIEP